MDRAFEGSILDMVALDQILQEMKPDMALSIVLQLCGYLQREIAEVGERGQQRISYHVKVAKQVARR